MPYPFQRTADTLDRDNGHVSGWLLVSGLFLLAAWLTWALTARVTHYEVSDSARLEVAGAASPLAATLSGIVKTSHLTLNETVTPGEILLELDDREQILAFQQEQIRYNHLQPQLASLENQIRSEDAGRTAEDHVLAFSERSAGQQVKQARADADLAAQQQLRSEKLLAAGLISQAAFEASKSAAENKAAALAALEQSEFRLAPELNVRTADRTAKQRQIFTDVAKLDADIAESRASLNRLRYEIDRRKLRAQVAGKLTECAVLHPGLPIAQGQQLGIILPSGTIQIVAGFDPASAFGKLHPGQPATVRLNGFPWAQFGVLNARVARVAGEIHDGQVRVELTPVTPGNPRIPLQHGLPGTVEIATEQLSPAALLLRSAGRTLGAH